MKLFVSDIDGTLYWYQNKNNQGCSAECKRAIKEWIEAGNVFAVATARVHKMRDRILEDIGINIDYLGGNGSEVIYRDGTEEMQSIPYSYFLEVGQWLDRYGYDASLKICVNDQFLSYRQDLYPFTCESRMRMNLRNSILHDKYSKEKIEGVNMSVLCHPQFTQEIEMKLQELFKGRCQVLATDMDNIDFIPIGVSKSEAILSLAKRYGVSTKEIIVIGDSFNDICMFNLTLNSYCMSHALDEVKKHANKIVDSVEEAIYKELAKE